MAETKKLKLGGSAVKGICFASDKTTTEDWYKVTLSSAKNIEITIQSKIDGTLKVEVCDSKGKTLWGGSKTIYDGEDETVLESSGKFSKGTYYIKLLKYNKESSGYYTVMVK